jgi:hypothetical protein
MQQSKHQNHTPGDAISSSAHPTSLTVSIGGHANTSKQETQRTDNNVRAFA